MLETLAAYLFLFALCYWLAQIRSQPRIISPRKDPTEGTGNEAEIYVATILSQLSDDYYHLINNVTLPAYGRTSFTQIDHMVVSNFGVFVIETKGHHGLIFGNIKDSSWTQVLNHSKYKIYNPLRQNFAHQVALETLLDSGFLKASPITLVAFPFAAKLTISGTDQVGTAEKVLEKIKGYSSKLYSDEERDDILKVLTKANNQHAEVKENHIREVQRLTSPHN